jgi:hypothetical protein
MSEGMRAAVTGALAGRTAPDPRDGAAAALALQYAGLIDQAAPGAKYRRPLEVLARTVAGMPFEEDDPGEALQVIATALSEHTVASDLGPKLLAVLAGLGLTTASRGEQRGEGKKSAPRDPLDELKAKRAERLANRGTG